MSLTAQEAGAVVQMLDVSWQDVPLRPETIAVWVNELATSERVLFNLSDAVEAIQFLLHTESRRPALSDFVAEGRSQFKARKQAGFEGQRNERLGIKIESPWTTADELNP